MVDEDKYYLLYEDRYRRIHNQGFRYWISDPDEYKHVMSSIDKFLDYTGCVPLTTSIIELGCGEGYVANHVLELGFSYLGVDISESAIKKARERAGDKNNEAFLLADVTELPQIADGSFDVAIDNQCFQMFVTDYHRTKYLSELKRILKNDGKLYFRENIQEEEFRKKVSSFREFMDVFGTDYTTLHDYPAYHDNQQHIVKLPRVPARFNNESGYRKELDKAGFTVEHYETDGWQCVIYACVRGKINKQI